MLRHLSDDHCKAKAGLVHQSALRNSHLGSFLQKSPQNSIDPPRGETELPQEKSNIESKMADAGKMHPEESPKSQPSNTHKWSLSYPTSGSWLSRRCWALSPSCGLGLLIVLWRTSLWVISGFSFFIVKLLKFPVFPFVLGSSGPYFATGLQEEEKAAVHKRSPKVLEALQKLNIQADQAPVIAVLGSGGGLRAHIACLGVLSELKELGLLDAVTYLAGVSGSTWALSSFFANNGNMESMEKELEERYEKNSWHFKESLTKAIQAARRENYSLTDFWAYLIVSRQMRELQDSNLSSIKEQVEEGVMPYPIFAAIDDDLQPEWRKRKTQKSWFEFTPHHAGYPALGAYIPITQFGSRFENGKVVRQEPERDLTFLRGLWGSAIADIEEVKKFIWDMLMDLIAKLKQNFQPMAAGAGPSTYIETPGKKVDQELLDLAIAYVKDHDDPSIKDKLWALQQTLSAEEDEFGQQKHSWIAEIGQNWNEISPEEKEQFLEYLFYCFMRTPEPDEDEMYSSKSWIVGLLQDVFTFLSKTGICFWRWEWGTVYNFLYKPGNITDETMHSREFLHLVDAGYAINTPYPLVLPPVREVHLILSFDFSSGDPLETIRAAADYCQCHAIPFPDVREDQLKEWAQAPASCYVLRGETGPVVMHFTLFNKDNCGDNIETWRQKYDTMKLSDTYTPDLVKDLLKMSRENVRKNRDNILNEMWRVAGKPGNFPRVYMEDSSGDTVQDVQGSRTVEIKISNNTDITFKNPLYYLQSGNVLVDPPPVLSPESTIICSFERKSCSFQGTVGLLVYQGPSVHLALMFSVPFNYALHRIEFAIAIITEPVSRDLESVFDSIQGNGSPEIKVAKHVLQIPQGTLKIEHDSLIITAIMSNIHVTKMDIMVETKTS
ncbi:cytosolic phospholipase A2 gamma [Acomys russatus]|uniref:cytosolic phospholipase A2 gamma n=1 Tax=Acomys russatus TaxID=60746 RepID=UPI0021E34288|nr:cytosolic phospholipase A2 gamma [Acomys russatus]